MKPNIEKVDPTYFDALLNSNYAPVVSIIIPSFNEEKSVGIVLQRTQNTLEKVGLPYEIIVINDGSTDRTSEIALRSKAILLENRQNMGKGASLRVGLKHTRGEYIVFMDADGESRPEDIHLLLYPFTQNEKLSVVIGSRFKREVDEDVTSRLHVFGNKIFNVMIFLLTRRYVSDSQSGFRVFKQPVLKDMNIDSSGFEVETEILLKILRRDLEFTEVPITFDRRIEGVPRLRTFRDGWKIVKAILKYSLLENG